jgi:3-isopropylmalate/(R)-2-methylmalate dehydratase small subunit
MKDLDNEYSFELDPFRKKCLLEGLDDIALTMIHSDKIDTFEKEYFKNT